MRLKRVGQAHGIDFSFAGKVRNTRDSHRMMHLAGLKGEDVQMKLAKELFAMHFEGDTDITCHGTCFKPALLPVWQKTRRWNGCTAIMADQKLMGRRSGPGTQEWFRYRLLRSTVQGSKVQKTLRRSTKYLQTSNPPGSSW
jgi:hypothetical protein